MIKKLFKVGMLACGLMFACNAFAQTEKQDFPRTGFWSNWSLGGDLGASWQSGQKAHSEGGWGYGMNIIAKKKLNWNWNLRGTVGSWLLHPTIENGVDPYATTTLGFEYSILNACRHNPDRKGDVYLIADAGFSYYLNRPNFGKVALFDELGIGASCKVNEKNSIFAEALLGNQADVPDATTIQNYLRVGQLDAFFGLGWMHHFGLTAADAEMIAQKALITQENVDNLNNQITELTNEVANDKQTEKKLNDRINELENQLKNRPADNGNADSLRRVIDQIKADQLTYYAIPFSILYPNDVWKVMPDQMDKLAAIAHIMKSDNSVKFTLHSYCDPNGSDEYNQKLSQRRAEEVKRLLVEKYGIDGDRISTNWHGETLMFGDNNYAMNRRTSVYRVIE